MRSRGAKVADIAILVIDASEGVKAQTKEVISLIRELSISTIVALNKIDKPDANPEKVKRELMKEGIQVESMGGNVLSQEISAKTKQGIPEMLDAILLLAEMGELKADQTAPAKGVIIESYSDSQRGPTATLLVTEGTLRKGDVIGTSTAFVKTRNLEDFQKKQVEEALPSSPVIVFGFNDTPKTGEEFKTFTDIGEAEEYVKKPEEKIRETDLTGEQRALNLIIKTDVLGSAEAIEGILNTLPQDKVVLRLLNLEAGDINENDIKMAEGGRATIIGFKVRVDSVAKRILEREKIRMMLFDVIYNLVEYVRGLMEKTVASEDVRTSVGKLKVLAKFLAEKNRQIIGGKVIEGVVKKGAKIDVFRQKEKVGQGRMINLQRNKKDIDSAPKGEECGILFEGDVKIEEGDILDFYIQEKIKSLE
jgi:translation initiation factor IF-2